MRKIAILTDSDHPNLYSDDQLLIGAFAQRGITAEPVIWDEIQISEIDFEAAIIRNTWNYHHRPQKFLSILEALEAKGVVLWNPLSVVKWNSTKLYLKEFEKMGVPIVPTHWIETNTKFNLDQKLFELGLNDAVIKPIVGGGSFLTLKVKRGNVSVQDQETADKVLEKIDTTLGLMIQPFVPEIVTEGEWSLIFFRNEFSHAVLRKPKTGDFRVQFHYGASFEAAFPGAEAIAQAKQILEKSGRETLFARVDLIPQSGRPMLLGELELIEPLLNFGLSSGSADRLVDAFFSFNL